MFKAQKKKKGDGNPNEVLQGNGCHRRQGEG
jgi:hypothetical protein